MKILIADKEYDFGDSVTRPPIGAVRDLVKATTASGLVTPKTIRLVFVKWADASSSGADVEDLLYSPEFLDNFAGLIFLVPWRPLSRALRRRPETAR